MDLRLSILHPYYILGLCLEVSEELERIKGLELITFQYLRMMGGIDTVMPDKIVKRMVNEILVKDGLEPINDDIEFVKKA
jgi:hypothetical protein